LRCEVRVKLVSKQAGSSSGEVRVGCAWIVRCEWDFSWREGRGVEATEEFVRVERKRVSLERKSAAIVLVPARGVKSIVKMHIDSSPARCSPGRIGSHRRRRLWWRRSCVSAAPSQSTPEFTSCRSLPGFVPRVYTTRLSHASAKYHMRHMNS
jgi:hypothetical protein